MKHLLSFLNKSGMTEDEFFGRVLYGGSGNRDRTYLCLEDFEHLPDGFRPVVQGHIMLRNLKELPKGFAPVVFESMLIGVEDIPEGFTFMVGCNLYLPNITIPPVDIRVEPPVSDKLHVVWDEEFVPWRAVYYGCDFSSRLPAESRSHGVMYSTSAGGWTHDRKLRGNPYDPYKDKKKACRSFVDKTTGIGRIAAERLRQSEEEGWIFRHVDIYGPEALEAAATCYAMPEDVRGFDIPKLWPWSAEDWKPSTRERDLEKAGALLAAALDRRMRRQ